MERLSTKFRYLWPRSTAEVCHNWNLFDRGHIHHVLTNPVYAGRIRHRSKVYEGQHDPIIDPDRWDRLQDEMRAGAARRRTGRGAIDRRHAVTSPLAGKFFDETGDRLTPSHSKTADGKRLRYYVSRRLIKDRAKASPDGWRLPAADLERQIAGLVNERIGELRRSPDVISNTVLDVGTSGTAQLQCISDGQRAEEDARDLCDLVECGEIAPCRISIQLSEDKLSDALGIHSGSFEQIQLTISTTFRQRKRGVERKLVIGNRTGSRDEALIRNLARAHAWFGELRRGRSYGEIAARTGTSKRRVMQVVELAFLAPELAVQILDGEQPAGLTSDILIKQGVPEDWAKQRRLFDSLR